MQPIPEDLLSQFNAIMDKKNHPYTLREEYRKWLRYFLDFCSKYDPPDDRSEKVRLFIAKIRSKGASEKDLCYAAHAVSLFFSIGTKNGAGLICAATAGPRHDAPASETVADNDSAPGELTPLPAKQVGPEMESPALHRPRKRYNEWWSMERTPSPQWDELIIEKLAGEINARHYSRKTLKAYADWSRKFQLYLKHRSPQSLTADDVKAYLTYLAVNCKVSASTQNQAFNSLLFLFRHILKKDFGDQRDVPRAKRSSYIPVVLTRQEIDSVLGQLSYPYDLVVKLLYGCGLRLFECLKLRVQNFNFDEGVLAVMDGKGKKARTIPIPRTIEQALLAQIEGKGDPHRGPPGRLCRCSS